MTDIIRVKAPVTEIIILLIALITTTVYGIQRTTPHGIIAWYHSPLMLFTSTAILAFGFILAYMSSGQPRIFTQYISGAIALSLVYPSVISGIFIARQKTEKDGGVYSSVYIILLILAILVMCLNIYVIIISPDFASNIIIYTIPIAVSILLFNSSILVSV
jgi:ABC-type spermidine/putrescine transport system permease subunit II